MMLVGADILTLLLHKMMVHHIVMAGLVPPAGGSAFDVAA